MTNKHRQVFVKVNTEVDEGIAPVIVALNRFPELQTIESCQGRANHKSVLVMANINFMYGSGGFEQDAWKKIANFTFGFFAPELDKLVSDSVDIKMERVMCNDFHRVTLSMRPDSVTIKFVADAIDKLYDKWIDLEN